VGVFRGFCVQLAGGLVGSRACPGWENSGDRHSGVIWGIRTASLGRELEPAFGLQEGYLHGGWRRMIFSSYGGQSLRHRWNIETARAGKARDACAADSG